MFIKVVKTSRFAFVRIKKIYPKRYMRSIRSSEVRNCLFLHARGWGIDLQVRKKLQIPGGVPGGGWGGVMVTSQKLTLFLGLRGRHNTDVDLLTGIHCFPSKLLFMFCSLSIVIHRHLF